jgi:hypothetical protein
MKLLTQDRQRYQLFRLLESVHTRKKLIAFLGKPCKHGTPSDEVCEKCDEDVHREEGYWPQEESA